nr:hypothetical protein BdHM001_29470 [Bdellovibrio sp. HM001]
MSSLLPLLQIYKWSLPSSVLMAGVLALVGAQWTAREKSAQIFVLGQGASLGIVLGLVINILLGTDFHGISLLIGLSLGWVTLLLTDLLIKSKSDRNHIYLTLFVFFLSLTYLVSYMTPALESHIAASYFGDLAVMSDTGAIGCLLAALVFGFYLITNWHKLSLRSFQLANHSAIHNSWKNHLFDLGTLLLTTMAIQNMGYLYTMGSLFIATSFAASRSRNLKGYLLRMLVIALVGSGAGFIVSLQSTNLPTVPCVLLGQMLIGLLLYTKK